MCANGKFLQTQSHLLIYLEAIVKMECTIKG